MDSDLINCGKDLCDRGALSIVGVQRRQFTVDGSKLRAVTTPWSIIFPQDVFLRVEDGLFVGAGCDSGNDTVVNFNFRQGLQAGQRRQFV